MEFPDEVCILKHPGTLAPWNIQRFSLLRDGDGSLLIRTKADVVNAIFYHFHGFKKFSAGYFFGTYPFSREARELIYEPYIQHLERNGIRVDSSQRNVSFKTRLKLWAFERIGFVLKE
jgi:hypothetical protein